MSSALSREFVRIMLTHNKATQILPQFAAVKDGIPHVLEAIAAVVGLIVSAPLLLLASGAIMLTSRGGALFRQERVGREGRIFIFYKLRTMQTANHGPEVTKSNDSRITWVGKWLRKTKLDELPALWNVVKGDMSLVGPRPEVPRYVDHDNKMWQLVLQVRPGITDPVTLRLRNEEELLAAVDEAPEEFYLRTLQPLKLKGYIEYLEHRDWRVDLGILWKSLLAVIIPSEAPAPMINGKAAKKTSLPYPLAKLRSRAGQHLLDLSLLFSAFMLSYLLRYEFSIPKEELPHALVQLGFVIPLQYITLYLVGVRRFIWRYISMAEVGVFAKAALLSSVPLLLLRLGAGEELQAIRVPISIIIMDTFVAFTGLALLRVVRRALYERYEKRKIDTQAISARKKPILLIGAGRAGVMAAKEINGRGDVDLEVKGFIDDEIAKQGSVIQGIKVCGTTLDLPRLVKELGIAQVIITTSRASRQNVRRIIDICEHIPVKVHTMPGLYEILGGQVEASPTRETQYEELTRNRQQVTIDDEAVRKALTGKAVMITGAGGVIGAELARQVMSYKPSMLLLLDRAEEALAKIHNELSIAGSSVAIVPILADAGNNGRLSAVFKQYQPRVILHAAAHRLGEIIELNPSEAISNNVLVTNRLGELAGKFGAEQFILISSYKAMKPVSVVGCSKRMAEFVLCKLKSQFPETSFIAIRFGEVTDWAGTFAERFREEIKKGGPVTVAHQEMKRHLMTAREATQLIVQCTAMTAEGEVFVLEMGPRVSIMEIAKQTIARAGLEFSMDIKIEFKGNGEASQLSEDPEIDKTSLSPTSHPMIYKADVCAFTEQEIAQILEELTALVNAGEEQKLRQFLFRLLKEDHSIRLESRPL